MKIIDTSKAKCKNCYRCVRHCPVKAIKIKDGQAEVVEERCILCGICLLQCPQNAKKIRNDLDRVKKLVSSNEKVVASIAPSYPVSFDVESPEQMFRILRNLGFDAVEETAVGAEIVSKQLTKLRQDEYQKPIITTACPVVKNLIEKYHPKLLNLMPPVVSPMIAHGRLIKKRYGQSTKVVFIGPCVAKKAEAEDTSVKGDIDAVLTFEELKNWINEKGVSIQDKTESSSDTLFPNHARTYPLPGGLLKTSRIKNDILLKDILVVDGIKNCLDVLNSLEKGEIQTGFIEILACNGGCIAGPVIGPHDSVYKRRQRLLEFIEKNKKNYSNKNITDGLEIDLSRSFEPKVFKAEKPGHKTVKQILKSIGKMTPEQELNCGACGYSSCREKAEAVYQGMAELDMCIPYMRSKAESLANIIIDSTPNGIILVDNKLNVQEINKSAEKLFKIKKGEVKNKPLRTIIDDTDFASVLKTHIPIFGKKVSYPMYSLTTTQTICYIKEHDLILGIIIDITKQEQQEKEFQKVREETLEKAQEVINKQMRVAQEIAGLLGETTAESKMLLLKLMNLVKKGENQNDSLHRSSL